jgi:uncharacterized protein YjbJ (UPF0337 family)
MKSATRNEVEGTVHEVKGKIRRKAGQLTNNRMLEAKGAGEKIAGKAQKKIGQLQKANKKA